MTRQSLAIVLAFAFLVAAPGRPGAVTAEFTPVIGHLAPQFSQIADAEAPLVIRQDAATAFGAQLTFWITPRIAAEASVLTGSSSIEIIANAQLNLNAQMLYVDARARFRVTDPSASGGLDLIAGVGMSDLSDALSDVGENVGLSSESVVTYLFGVGASMAVSDRLSLRFEVLDYIHDSNFEVDEAAFGTPVDTRGQNDLVITAGIVIPVWN